MTLSRKDAYATVVVAAGVALALSVLLSWNWPLMNGERAGIIALGVAGMIACSVSGWATDETSFRDPFVVIGAVLGVVALGIGIVGLITGSTAYLGALTIAVVLLWMLTIGHRLLGGAHGRSLTAA